MAEAKQTGQQKALQLANQQVAEIKRRLEIKSEEIRFVLDDDRHAAKLMMGALMQASDDPKIRECEPNSVVRAVIQAALCGAELAAGRGEGYLVPYFNKDLGVKECQFMPGYRLGQRHVQEATGLRVIADVVCQNDHWRYTQVPLALEHTPAEGVRGDRLRSYAVALNDNNYVMFAQIATAADIEQAKKASRKGRDQNSPAWRDWEDRMWRKVAIMRLAKEARAWKPGGKIDHMLEAEEMSYTGARASIGDMPSPRVLPPTEPVAGVHKIGARKQATAEKPVEEEPPPVEKPTEEAAAVDNGKEGKGKKREVQVPPPEEGQPETDFGPEPMSAEDAKAALDSTREDLEPGSEG